jgi:hypothetical protein
MGNAAELIIGISPARAPQSWGRFVAALTRSEEAQRNVVALRAGH